MDGTCLLKDFSCCVGRSDDRKHERILGSVKRATGEMSVATSKYITISGFVEVTGIEVKANYHKEPMKTPMHHC